MEVSAVKLAALYIAVINHGLQARRQIRGLRIQHTLRAFTPKDRKTVKSVAETFRSNPDIDALKSISELGIGEALVSVLDRQGTPTPVERILIRSPESQIGPLSADERNRRIARSPLHGRYETTVDRESCLRDAPAARRKTGTGRKAGRPAPSKRQTPPFPATERGRSANKKRSPKRWQTTRKTANPRVDGLPAWR